MLIYLHFDFSFSITCAVSGSYVAVVYLEAAVLHYLSLDLLLPSAAYILLVHTPLLGVALKFGLRK